MKRKNAQGLDEAVGVCCVFADRRALLSIEPVTPFLSEPAEFCCIEIKGAMRPVDLRLVYSHLSIRLLKNVAAIVPVIDVIDGNLLHFALISASAQ